MKRFLVKCLSLALACVLGATMLIGCKDDGPRMVFVGNPSATRFTKGEIARCVWDMRVYGGKLYLGGGDYTANTGPTDIWAYDLKAKEWEKSGSVQEEAIARFVEIDGELITTGIDPEEDWVFGNYYTLKNGVWEKTRNLPNAVHNYDMIEYDGKLFAGVGVDHGYYPFVYSVDGGKSFEMLKAYKDGVLVDLEQYEYSRAYELFEFKSKLYAIVVNTLKITDTEQSPSHELQVYEYQDGAMNFCADISDTVKLVSIGYKLFGGKAEYNGKMFVSTDYLYVSENISTFTKIKLPQNERVGSFLVDDGKMYVCAFKYHDQTFTITLYESFTGTSDFKKVYSFDYNVPAISFVKYGNDFYLGMGNRIENNDSNGNVLLITRE